MSVQNSLKALQTDYIDVLLIHRPDPLTRSATVARAFASLKAAGKVKHFGVSNYSTLQVSSLQRELKQYSIELYTNQIQLSPFHPYPLFDGTLDQLVFHDLFENADSIKSETSIIPQIWSPLGGGRLFSPQAAEVLENELRHDSQAF